MKLKYMSAALAFVGVASLTSCESHSERATLKNSADTLSYALGYTKGESIRNSISKEIPGGDTMVQKDIMIAGFINAMMQDKKNSQLTMEEAQAVIQDYFKDLEMRRKLAEADAYQKTKAKNEQYMEERAKEEGMKSLPKPNKYDGPAVLVKESKVGRGDTIGLNDFVYMTMVNKLTDGQNIYGNENDAPKMMPVKGLVQGLQQGLNSLRCGSIATIIVPSELAFGRQGRQGIPANAILIFDVAIEKVFHTEAEAKAFWKLEKEKRAAIKAATTEEAAAN